MIKSYGVGGVGGGPWDFSVSPSPFGLDFGTRDFGTLDSGLTAIDQQDVLALFKLCIDVSHTLLHFLWTEIQLPIT